MTIEITNFDFNQEFEMNSTFDSFNAPLPNFIDPSLFVKYDQSENQQAYPLSSQPSPNYSPSTDDTEIIDTLREMELQKNVTAKDMFFSSTESTEEAGTPTDGFHILSTPHLKNGMEPRFNFFNAPVPNFSDPSLLRTFNQAENQQAYPVNSQSSPIWFSSSSDAESINEDWTFVDGLSSLNTNFRPNIGDGWSDNPYTDLETLTKTRGKRGSTQNPDRNNPGLIFMRVKKGLKTVFNRNPRHIPSHFKYIIDILQAYRLDRADQDHLIEFLDGRNRARKTWEGVKDNLRGSGLYGQIILDCIDGLLSKTGEDDFNNWMNEWRGNPPARDALVENKESHKYHFINDVKSVLFEH